MRKIILQEESTEGLKITIVKETGNNCYELSLDTSSLEVSKEELLLLKSMITEILES